MASTGTAANITAQNLMSLLAMVAPYLGVNIMSFGYTTYATIDEV